jgi:hypothetical protein
MVKRTMVCEQEDFDRKGCQHRYMNGNDPLVTHLLDQQLEHSLVCVQSIDSLLKDNTTLSCWFLLVADC